MKTMLTKIAVLIMFLSLTLTSGFSQEKSKKELKNEQKLEKQRQIDSLVNSKEFVFIATMAMPQGTRSINLTTRDNFVKFHPETIEGDMPYFGRSYSGAGYGGDAGIKFDGKPEEYTVTKSKKNFEIKAIIKGEKDTYKLNFTVSFTGNATLSVSSNNRSHISYNGDISAPEKHNE